MIARFSLYGFLKNQRYFEPFIVLFFLDQGLSFAQIGLLIGFRELCHTIGEIPSGAVADLYGRRRCMMFSFVAYIASFMVFGFLQSYAFFFLAMFLFAVGEAFRTGTHKSMIFTWLRIQGRTDEKNKVYGYTRSWSQLGSAFSIIVATVIVVFTYNYGSLFLIAIIPYSIGLLNFMSYPRELDGKPSDEVSLRNVIIHLRDALRDSLTLGPLRRLMIESMAFEGVFKAAKDYIQPILKNMALAIPVFVAMEETRRTAIVVGVVYLVLHLGSAYASRHSHEVAGRAGGEERGSSVLWKVSFLLYLLLIPLLLFELYYGAIALFVALYLIQNLWRPLLISRFDAFSTEQQQATVLSIESQAKATSTMIVAPLLGLAVDRLESLGGGGGFWPVGAIGAVAALFVLLSARRQGDSNVP